MYRSCFSVVELEVNSMCNRKCDYCHTAIQSQAGIPEYMSDEVFDRIIRDLKRINFSGKISYHHYNEPLLRVDLERLVAVVRKELPDVYQLLFTNGDFLSETRYSSLVNAGVNHFFITLHGSNQIPKRLNQTIKSSSDSVLVNRGGFLSQLAQPITTPCYSPSELLVVTVTGDIILCPDDAEKKIVMGNIMHQPLEKIWFSQNFISIRKRLVKGMREYATEICTKCDNEEYSAPGSA